MASASITFATKGTLRRFAIVMIIFTPLHLTIDEVVISESKRGRLKITLLTIGVKLVLGSGAVTRAIVEELDSCTVLIFHLLTGCISMSASTSGPLHL